MIALTHSILMALDLSAAEDPAVALQLFNDSHLGIHCSRAQNRAKQLKGDS